MGGWTVYTIAGLKGKVNWLRHKYWIFKNLNEHSGFGWDPYRLNGRVTDLCFSGPF